jgi:uncharacterized protein
MSTAPSKRDIPQTVDPRKLANQSVTLSGFFKPEQLPRLADAVVAINEPVATELIFFVGGQNVKSLTGSVSANVFVTCHRCLQPMPLTLNADIGLGMIWDEEAAQHMPADLEPWVVGSDSADLCVVVEDELLLVLPYVNYHDESECSGIGFFTTGDVEDEQKKPNPFQILEQLKGKC